MRRQKTSSFLAFSVTRAPFPCIGPPPGGWGRADTRERGIKVCDTTGAVRLPPDVYQQLQAASALTGLSLESIAAVACLDWLRRHDMQRDLWDMQGKPGPEAHE